MDLEVAGFDSKILQRFSAQIQLRYLSSKHQPNDVDAQEKSRGS